MSTFRISVVVCLIGLVGAAAMWWVWPAKVEPAGGAVGNAVTPAPRNQPMAGKQPSNAGVVGGSAKKPRPVRFAMPKNAPAAIRADPDGWQERCRAVDEWATSGTDEGVEKAIAAATAEPVLREVVLQAFGQSKSAKAAEYLAAALQDPDQAVMCTAIGAWAASQGEGGIAKIAEIMDENLARTDGWREEIANACVKAIGETGSSAALPVLDKEFERVSNLDPEQWSMEYVEALIAAVGDVGDSRGAEMLERYADELQGQLSGNPEIRKRQMLMIAEALKKAEELK